MSALAAAFGFGSAQPKFEPQTFGNALNTYNVGRYAILKDVDANELKHLRAAATELLRKRSVDDARAKCEELIKAEKRNLAEKAIATMCATLHARREEFAPGRKLPTDLTTATAAVFWAGARMKKKYPELDMVSYQLWLKIYAEHRDVERWAEAAVRAGGRRG